MRVLNALCFHFLCELGTRLCGEKVVEVERALKRETLMNTVAFPRKISIAVAGRGAQRGVKDHQVAIKTELSLEKKKNSRLLQTA